MVSMKISHDKNGNKVLKISKSDLCVDTGFSIQTLGNLPETHKHGVHYATKGEVFNFISEYGTKRQKQLLQVESGFSLLDIVNGEKRDKHYNVTPFWRELTEPDIDQIVKMIGGQNKTKQRVKSCLTYDLRSFPHWFLERVNFNRERWEYCAGQDYNFEMADIRRRCK